LHAFEGRVDGVLTISAQLDADSVALTVADNGVGMPAELLEKLFEPFFSTKIGKGGTGLGMAIVQNLVTKALGGRIKVASELGQGSRFEIVLPKVMLG
jgi:signal transduction histidine kinase